MQTNDFHGKFDGSNDCADANGGRNDCPNENLHMLKKKFMPNGFQIVNSTYKTTNLCKS